MAVKVGINGFGRIGRNIFRTAIGDKDIDFVAVNDITDTRTLAHLLKYDSVLGNLHHEISASENGIKVEDDELRVFSERDPAVIPWESVGAEIVVESTGRFTKAEDARKHLRGSVKKVIISAPAKVDIKDEPPPPAPKATPHPPISGGVLNGKAVHLVTPPYPAIARSAHAA